MKKLKKILTQIIFFFAGSWWGAGIHMIWFVLWVILRLPLNVLTFIVSLEAILISIVILRSENEAAEIRERMEKYERESDREIIAKDLEMDERTRQELVAIKQELRLIKEMVRESNS